MKLKKNPRKPKASVDSFYHNPLAILICPSFLPLFSLCSFCFLSCFLFSLMVEFSPHMSNVNVQVSKGQSENIAGLIRRFQKRVQEAGILPRVRSLRYSNRELSDLKTKRAKLRKIENTLKYEKAKRMGKVIERKKRR